MWDIASWNTAGARLQHVVSAMRVRPGIWALQEVRVPNHSDWVSVGGYLSVHGRGDEARGSCGAVGVLNDVATNHRVKAVQVSARKVHISLTEKNCAYEFNMMTVYIPPQGSRHYSDEEMEATMSEAQEVDFLCGDFNWRPDANEVERLSDGAKEISLPERHVGWRPTQDRRGRIIVEALPRGLAALKPRTSRDWTARTDYENRFGYEARLHLGLMCCGPWFIATNYATLQNPDVLNLRPLLDDGAHAPAGADRPDCAPDVERAEATLRA